MAFFCFYYNYRIVKSDSVVKHTLPEDNNQIFAFKYKLYMPNEEELKSELAKEQEILELEKGSL